MLDSQQFSSSVKWPYSLTSPSSKMTIWSSSAVYLSKCFRESTTVLPRICSSLSLRSITWPKDSSISLKGLSKMQKSASESSTRASAIFFSTVLVNLFVSSIMVCRSYQKRKSSLRPNSLYSSQRSGVASVSLKNLIFSLTVSLRKKCFQGRQDTFPRMYIFPRTRFKLPTNISRKELQPDCFLPIRVNLSPGCTPTLNSINLTSKLELECGQVATVPSWISSSPTTPWEASIKVVLSSSGKWKYLEMRLRLCMPSCSEMVIVLTFFIGLQQMPSSESMRYTCSTVIGSSSLTSQRVMVETTKMGSMSSVMSQSVASEQKSA